jgi:SWI/SNF-related matrix-associated actin-dependent regulator 1 of chromatin subfamily A
MVRRTKDKVLTQLPDKQYEIVKLDVTVQADNGKSDRYNIGMAKVKDALSYLHDLLADREKVVVFAHHADVLDALETGLAQYHPVRICGSTPVNRRSDIAKSFQENPKHRVFLGHLVAAGTGLTLTASSDVVMVEFSWAPGENAQAEDRCHRITQKNCVTIHYLIAENTLDEVVVAVIERKKNNIADLMDGEQTQEEIT